LERDPVVVHRFNINRNKRVGEAVAIAIGIAIAIEYGVESIFDPDSDSDCDSEGAVRNDGSEDSGWRRL